MVRFLVCSLLTPTSFMQTSYTGKKTCESVAGRRNTSLTLQWTGYFVRSLGVPFFLPRRSLAAYIVLEVGNSPAFVK